MDRVEELSSAFQEQIGDPWEHNVYYMELIPSDNQFGVRFEVKAYRERNWDSFPADLVYLDEKSGKFPKFTLEENLDKEFVRLYHPDKAK